MQREDVFKIIPKPKNEEVIVYDISLKDLLDIDVLGKYYDDLASYNIKKENYNLLNQEIKQYEENINKIYLYDKKWTEIDYLEKLQQEKKNYSYLYNDINKIQNNINILEKKYKTIEEQIEIQRRKDLKEIEDKKKNIDNEIENDKNKLLKLNNKINEIKLEYDRLNFEISDINEEIEFLNSMKNELENKECKCEYCGSIITSKSAKRSINKILREKLEKKNKILKSLKNAFNKSEQSLAYFENELRICKINLKNNMEFKKQDYDFYLKKSLKILELEAIRDEIVTKITGLKKEYKKNTNTKSIKFIDSNDRIKKYELSMENLKKIKEYKNNFKEKYANLNVLRNELLALNNNLQKYKKFLEIFYKIYEQKINNYFGNDIKFKIFRFNDLELEKIFEVYYKNIEYNQLNKIMKNEFDNLYIEKISYFY